MATIAEQVRKEAEQEARERDEAAEESTEEPHEDTEEEETLDESPSPQNTTDDSHEEQVSTDGGSEKADDDDEDYDLDGVPEEYWAKVEERTGGAYTRENVDDFSQLEQLLGDRDYSRLKTKLNS